MSWETWQPGRVYRVPVARGTWRNWTRDWVILGPWHEDAEIIGFPDHHYHLDPRFISRGVWNPEPVTTKDLMYFLAAPLMAAVNPAPSWVTPTPIGLRRRKMQRQVSAELMAALFAEPPWGRKLREVYCGQHLRGTVCPHRGADLRGFEPGADGMVTCPLHGLRFHVES